MYGNRRLLHNSLVDPLIDVLQSIHLIQKLHEGRTFELREHHADRREHLYGISEGDQIPRVCGLIADACDQPLHIVDGMQVFPQFLAAHDTAVKLPDCIITLLNLRFADQRLLHVAAKEPCTHGGFCLVQHPQKRALLVFLPHGFHQLQVAPRGRIQYHKGTGGIGMDAGHVLQPVHLCLVQVF